MQRSTRHGELKGELRQKVEVTRLQLAMASSKRKQRKEGMVTRLPCAMASAGRAQLAMASIYSGGELRRSIPSELTWQKPTGEESLTRHGEHTYSRGELSQRKKYKRPFNQIRWRDHIRPDYLMPLEEERKQGKTRETLKSKEHKDWRKTQDHWDIMAWFHSISSFLLVRLPWQWVTKLFLLGLNVVNSIRMYSFWLRCCVILIHLMILILFLLPMFWSYGFEWWLKNTFWI